MTIAAIRDNINNNIGKDVLVIHNEGRNKVYKYRGKLLEVYNNIFIVMDNGNKRSFSYYDVLTNTIKISFKL